MASLSDDDFSLLGLERRFELDLKALSEAYLQLQNQMHPDRFADKSAAEKRLAVQWSTRINEAYKRLQNPLERGIYLCELAGTDPKGRQSNLPPALLMQQMEWRERLEDTRDADALGDLLDEVLAEKRLGLKNLQQQLDEQHDVAAAHQTVQALLFIDKFGIEVKKRLEHLEDMQ